jgi:GNAT superfamily N-acetyltransferase
MVVRRKDGGDRAAKESAAHPSSTVLPKPNARTEKQRPDLDVRESLPATGLEMRAKGIEPLPPLPSGVRGVRKATEADAEAIAAIQEQYQLRKIDVADHPKNGWLVQKSTPDAIRWAIGHYKDLWVAESDEGKVVGFQAVSAARFISRPAQKHKFFGRFAERARKVLASARFIYMSQVAVVPEYAGRGLAHALQARVLARYDQTYPLAAHVAVFTQADFDAWNQDPQSFSPRDNNVASHRYHQKLGYVPVAWTSDLRGTVEYNSGIEGQAPGAGSPPPVLGLLYMHFRDGAEALPYEYVDPVKAVLDTPCKAGECNSEEWANPFPPAWPDQSYDMSGDWDCGFVPNFTGMYKWYVDKLQGELARLRAPRVDED